MTTKHVFVLLVAAVSAAGAFAEDDLAWVDSTIARFGTNYTVLAENAKFGYTKEAPYPKTFRNGKVVFCKDWDWCSGFFQGYSERTLTDWTRRSRISCSRASKSSGRSARSKSATGSP